MKTQWLLVVSLMVATPLSLTPRKAHAQDAQSPSAPQDLQASPAPGPAPTSGSRGDGGDLPWGPRHDWEHRDRPGLERGIDRDHGPARDWAREGERGDALLSFGMWWKNPEMVALIGLTPDQQKRITDLFIQSRVKLIRLHATLQEEQLLLEPFLDASPLDEAKTLAQIDKIADTRADLEKTNARMLLNIRGVLTAEQWTKLRSHSHGPLDRNDLRTQGPPRSN